MAKNKRKQGEGTLRQRTDGRWEGRIVVGYNGKRHSQNKKCNRKNKI